MDDEQTTTTPSEQAAPDQTVSAGTAPLPTTPGPDPAVTAPVEPVVASEEPDVEFREGTKGDQGDWVADDEPDKTEE